MMDVVAMRQRLWKPLFRFAACGLWFAAVGTGCAPPPVGVTAAVHGGAVVTPAFEHDFGIVPPQAELHHTFAVRNPGPTEWALRRVSESCSCTAADISAKRVSPGETVEVQVSYRAKSSLRDDEETIRLDFTGREAPVVLRVRARIRKPISFFPEALNAGTVGRGKQPRVHFQIQNHSGADWEVLTLRPDTDRLVASATPIPVEPSVPSEPRQAWRGEVRLWTDGLHSGRHRGEITVEARGGSETFHAVLPVEFRVEPPVTALPGRFFLGRIAAGESMSRSVLLRLSEDIAIDPAEVEVTHDLPGRLKVTVARATENDLTLEATLAPEPSDRHLSGTVVVRFRSKNLPDLDIPVTAVVKTDE